MGRHQPPKALRSGDAGRDGPGFGGDDETSESTRSGTCCRAGASETESEDSASPFLLPRTATGATDAPRARLAAGGAGGTFGIAAGYRGDGGPSSSVIDSSSESSSGLAGIAVRT